MRRGQRIRLSDVRNIYRLIAHCREAGGDAVAWRSRLGRGLSELLNTETAGASEVPIERLDSEIAQWKQSAKVRLVSIRPLNGSGLASIIRAERLADDAPFTIRQGRLLRCLHHELAPLLGTYLQLHAARPLDRPPAAPSQRLQQVLAHLVRGDSEKQVARALRISPNTLHVHVKRLYRHYNVHTRAELLAMFIRQRSQEEAVRSQELAD